MGFPDHICVQQLLQMLPNFADHRWRYHTMTLFEWKVIVEINLMFHHICKADIEIIMREYVRPLQQERLDLIQLFA